MTLLRCLALASLCIAVSACSSLPGIDHATIGPFFKLTNVRTTASRLPPDLHRVLVLPVSGDRALTEETLARLDETVRTELSRLARFEIVVIPRDELFLKYGFRQINSTDTIPAEFSAQIFSPNNRYGADAVLFIDVTTHSPYPPLNIGLRAKLARIRDSEIIWAADHVFAASEPAVANSARRYAANLGGNGGPGDLSHTVLQNPARFAGYASAATFATIPTH